MRAKIYAYPRLFDVIKTTRPLLMLDRVEVDTDRNAALGKKVVSANEPYFPGHFPDAPIMPGVLQLAALAQAAEALLRTQGVVEDNEDLKITTVNRYKFRSPALPGDLLDINVELVEETHGIHRFKGAVTCQGKAVSQGEFTLKAVTGIPDRENTESFHAALPLTEEEKHRTEGREECAAIMRNIPHRFPFLLVDRQICFDKEKLTNVVVKNISGGEAFFHALRRPVLPEYLQAEIAAQAGCALAFETPESEGKLAYYMSIDKAEFSEEIVAGDQVLIRVEAALRGKLGSCVSRMFVGERQMAELSVKFVFVDKE
ncbi:MAG: hypothetical protein RRC34_13945 [Lentisphaeria bacterium]|nr:hypothetical protein [Lentisphaeria bacterium]